MNSLRRIIGLTCKPQTSLYLRASFSANTGSKEFIDGLVKDKQIVVFMKGTPDQPMCGFSKAVVQILDRHGVHKFESHNVLEDEDLRQGIKEYSNWPTIPQVYMKGEFVGGCDIMLQMHQNGDLIDELEKIGIQSALTQQESSEK